MTKTAPRLRVAPIKWQGEVVRMENYQHSYVYSLFYKVLADNPSLKRGQLLDLALAALFAPHSKQARAVFRGNLAQLNIDFTSISKQSTSADDNGVSESTT